MPIAITYTTTVFINPNGVTLPLLFVIHPEILSHPLSTRIQEAFTDYKPVYRYRSLASSKRPIPSTVVYWKSDDYFEEVALEATEEPERPQIPCIRPIIHCLEYTERDLLGWPTYEVSIFFAGHRFNDLLPRDLPEVYQIESRTEVSILQALRRTETFDLEGVGTFSITAFARQRCEFHFDLILQLLQRINFYRRSGESDNISSSGYDRNKYTAWNSGIRNPVTEHYSIVESFLSPTYSSTWCPFI